MIHKSILITLVLLAGCSSPTRKVSPLSYPPPEIVAQLPDAIARLNFPCVQSQADVMEQLGLGAWFGSKGFPYKGARHGAIGYRMNENQLLELVMGTAVSDFGIAGVVLFENRNYLARNVNTSLLSEGQPNKTVPTNASTATNQPALRAD